jgi:hypothetical protein
MLGALLSNLSLIHPADFLDDLSNDMDVEDTHWSGDKNRFEDWLLHLDEDATTDMQPFY